MDMSWNGILATHQPHGQEITEGREVVGNQAGNNVEMNIVMNHQHDVGNSSGSSNRRKKQSKVWEEMTKFKGEDGRDWARCNHCGRKFDGSSKKGTTHLKNHLDRCPRKRNTGGDDADRSIDQITNLTSPVVIKEKSLIDLIKNCFHPTQCGNPSVLNSRKVEILQVYKEEKEKLRGLFSGLSCRFNLNIGVFGRWYVLTVWYIDNKWERERKIISVHDAIEDGMRDNSHQNLIKILRESCLDLNIDGNIYSVSYDAYEDEDDHEDVIGEINSWFSQPDNPLFFVGFLFSPHALCLIYDNFKRNLGKWLWKTFGEIRECIDYVNSTTSNMRNFQIAVDNAMSMGKEVNISNPFPKNARSVKDLVTAAGYKEALRELELIDSDFKSRSINLTKERWDEAAAVCQHDKELRGSIHNLYRSINTPENPYFPEFFDLYIKIIPLQRIQLDEATSTAIEKLASALEKYKLVLVIAVVLDPRFKMETVQLWYNKIYGCDADHYLEKIMDDFIEVYNEYAKVFEFDSGDVTTSYLDVMGRPCTSSYNMLFSSHKSSELERYLKESKVPSLENFDILAWWRIYTSIFPTLARMARDFLALPVNVLGFYKFLQRTVNTADSMMCHGCQDDDIIPALIFLNTMSA